MPWATSPKNFVPAPPVVATGEPYENRSVIDAERLSGWISLQVVTETPLFIRGSGSEPNGGHDDETLNERMWRQYNEMGAGTRARIPAADFSHHGDPDLPVIPGSSLRGAIRNVFAIMSESRLRTEETEPLMFRALMNGGRVQQVFQNRIATGWRPITYPDPAKTKGGFLFRDREGWWIKPALARVGPAAPAGARVGLATSVGSFGQGAVVFQPGDRLRVAPDGWTHAGLLNLFLVHPIPGGTPQDDFYVCVRADHYYHGVFRPTRTELPVPVPADVRRAAEARDRTPRSLPPQRRLRTKDIPERDRAAGALPAGLTLFPVFYYCRNGQVTSVGTSLFSAQRYDHSPASLVPYQVTPAHVDPVDALFGRIDQAIATRVRFSDLHLVGPASWAWDSEPNYCTTAVPLLSPKPQAVQIYLRQDEAYPDPNNLATYDDDAEIRGFARYFHRPDVVGIFEALGAQAAEARKTKAIMRPLSADCAFDGHIGFSDLTPAELGLLLRALRLPKTMRHKLGGGKPLGMGSVRVDVREVTAADVSARWSRPFRDTGHRRLPQAEINRLVSSAGRPDPTFWASPRMTELAALLEWDNAPPLDRTAQVAAMGDDVHPQWQQRWPLPPASRVREP